jgi:hypothetical protein
MRARSGCVEYWSSQKRIGSNDLSSLNGRISVSIIHILVVQVSTAGRRSSGRWLVLRRFKDSRTWRFRVKWGLKRLVCVLYIYGSETKLVPDHQDNGVLVLWELENSEAGNLIQLFVNLHQKAGTSSTPGIKRNRAPSEHAGCLLSSSR